MINLDKYKGDYQQLARIVNQINQRVRVLERQGYNVNGVSQNAELYNDPQKYAKLLEKYNEIMQPDYIDKLHADAIKTMETNLNKMFGEDIKVDMTTGQLKMFIKQYPEYASLMTLSPDKAKQELQKTMDIVGGTKEGIIGAMESVKTPKPVTQVPRPSFKKKRRSMSKSKRKKGRR